MTVTEDREVSELGAPRLRKEDQRLITGRTRWTDNLQLTGMLHLAMVRSPYAHARITSIDTSAARSSHGVHAVYTGADLADEQGSLPCAWAVVPEQKSPTHPSIAVDHVAFAGEIVAVIVARSAAEARDAVELVEVEYDELPPVLDLKAAARDEVLAHPDLGTNVSAVWSFDSAESGTGRGCPRGLRVPRPRSVPGSP
jgi:carbon-monoxide dehydrogenase large subunit